MQQNNAPHLNTTSQPAETKTTKHPTTPHPTQTRARNNAQQFTTERQTQQNNPPDLTSQSPNNPPNLVSCHKERQGNSPMHVIAHLPKHVNPTHHSSISPTQMLAELRYFSQ